MASAKFSGAASAANKKPFLLICLLESQAQERVAAATMVISAEAIGRWSHALWIFAGRQVAIGTLMSAMPM